MIANGGLINQMFQFTIMTLRSKDKGSHIYKACLQLVARIPPSFFERDVHILHNVCPCLIVNNISSRLLL